MGHFPSEDGVERVGEGEAEGEGEEDVWLTGHLEGEEEEEEGEVEEPLWSTGHFPSVIVCVLCGDERTEMKRNEARRDRQIYYMEKS